MDAKISERTKNPLLGREEILLAIEETKETPSRKDLRKKIAALAGANEELVMVVKIEHHFGSKNLSCKARIYESREKMDSVEAKFIVDRNLGVKKKEGDAKDNAPAPAATEKEVGEKAEKKKELKGTAPEKKESAPESKEPEKEGKKE